MQKTNAFKTWVTITSTAIALLVGAFLMQSSRVLAQDKAAAETTTTTTTTVASEPAQKQIKGGSQLWSENCARCHNMRSPSSYSDGEWEVVMHHMRVRAHLTPEEHKAILEFLKSAN